MILSFFTKRKRQQGIELLYGAIMAKALNPFLYLHYGVPDTFEGRFEAVTLHSALVLRRLKALPPPAAEMAQELVDRVFDGLESAMREVGIGGMGVPKRMKSFATGFYGRLAAYTEALDGHDPDALTTALGRNILEGGQATPAFVAYVADFANELNALNVSEMGRGALPATAPGRQEERP